MKTYEVDDRLLQDAIEKGVRRASRSLPIRRTALVVAVLLALSIGTVAVSVTLGFIGWDGNPKEERHGAAPETTVPPDNSATQRQAQIDARMDALMETKPAGEYWRITWQDGTGERGPVGFPTASVDTLEAGVRAVRAAGLRIPDTAPEGFHFASLELGFYFTQEDIDQTVLLSEETLADRMTLKRYAPPESIQDQITSYRMVFADDQGHELVLDAERLSATMEYSFGVQEGGTYEVVAVKGMDHALAYEHVGLDTASLYLLQTEVEPKTHMYFFDVEDPQPEMQELDNVVYTLRVDKRFREELMRVAEGMR